MTMSKPVFIYALIDPFTNEVRYIGKSIRPKERLTNQMNENSNTHRCHWIQSLKSKGVKPIQKILEEIPNGDNWQDRERAWIAKGKELGWKLTNATSGGDGVPDLPPEAREKMRQTWLGRKHKPESRLKMSEANKGHKHTEEYKQMMSKIMKNRHFSKETRNRISESNKKLTMAEANTIRYLLKKGYRQKRLAEVYGVDKGTISNIKRNLFYKTNIIIPDWLYESKSIKLPDRRLLSEMKEG